MEKKLQLAGEILSCLSGMDMKLIAADDDTLSAVIREVYFESSMKGIPERGIGTVLASMEPDCVYMLSSILGLTCIVLRIREKNAYLIVGPCHVEGFSENRIRSRLASLNLNRNTVAQIVTYCRWQPELSAEKLHQLGMLLARHLLNQPEPSFRHIEYHWRTDAHPAMMPPEPDEDQSRIRQIEMRYEASAAMTEAVKQGNLSLALRFLQNIDAGMSSVVRNPDPLRNAQNFCIILNTQLRYALEERRIHPYRLDRISNEIATNIEGLQSLDDVSRYYPRIVRQYCDLALEKSYPHLKPFIRQAVVYIKNHLADNLTVKATAKALVVNANYLSGQFHREVGMTFTDFVNRERTAQAAALLRHTNMQVQQIAAAVGYNNTSYFAKQFLRFHGVTPREYRSSGIL